ncbi:hypothetical protein FH972_026229 [Carpinus fangiana]|uniref:Uncharacterized protein n=1 Tax=Carpinus fangiana TaxID=176857 RepID=A0A5N6L3E6_9ROSI|nr:hypothetical protein FH972_026229 [Carpinus fangiana]
MHLLKLFAGAAISVSALAYVHVDDYLGGKVDHPVKKRAIGHPADRLDIRQAIALTGSESVTTSVSVVVVDVYPTISTSTVLSTSTVTVHQCPATVLDCPARSRSIAYVTSVVPVSISLCPTTYVSYSFSAMPTTYASGATLTSSSGNSYGISTVVVTHTPEPTISYIPRAPQTPTVTTPAYVSSASPPTYLTSNGTTLTSSPVASNYGSSSSDVSSMPSSYGSISSVLSLTPSAYGPGLPSTSSPSSGYGPNLTTTTEMPSSYGTTLLSTGVYSITTSSSLPLYASSEANTSVVLPPSTYSGYNGSSIATAPAYPSSILPPPYGVTPTSVYTTVVSSSGIAYTSVVTSTGLPSIYSTPVASDTPIVYTSVVSSGPGGPAYTTAYTLTPTTPAGYPATSGTPLPVVYTSVGSNGPGGPAYTSVFTSMPQTDGSYSMVSSPAYGTYSVLPVVTPSESGPDVPGYTVVVGPGPSTYLTTVIPYGPSTPIGGGAPSYTIIVPGPSSTLTTAVPSYSVSSVSTATYPASGYTTIVYPGYGSSSSVTTVIPVTGYTTTVASSTAPVMYSLPSGISSPLAGYTASVIIPGSTTIAIPPPTYGATSSPAGGNGTSTTLTSVPASYTGQAGKHVAAGLSVMLGLGLAVLAA